MSGFVSISQSFEKVEIISELPSFSRKRPRVQGLLLVLFRAFDLDTMAGTGVDFVSR